MPHIYCQVASASVFPTKRWVYIQYRPSWLTRAANIFKGRFSTLPKASLDALVPHAVTYCPSVTASAGICMIQRDLRGLQLSLLLKAGPWGQPWLWLNPENLQGQSPRTVNIDNLGSRRAASALVSIQPGCQALLPKQQPFWLEAYLLPCPWETVSYGTGEITIELTHPSLVITFLSTILQVLTMLGTRTHAFNMPQTPRKHAFLSN